MTPAWPARWRWPPGRSNRASKRIRAQRRSAAAPCDAANPPTHFACARRSFRSGSDARGRASSRRRAREAPGEHLALQPLLTQHPRQRRIANAFFLIDRLQTNISFAIDEDHPTTIGKIVPLAKIREEDNGEFQPLGAVHAHDADDVI